MTFLASTLNVSEDGALVTAPLRLATGRIVDVAIALGESEITVQGQVVWSNASLRRGGAELGLKFLSPQGVLIDYLRSAAQLRAGE